MLQWIRKYLFSLRKDIVFLLFVDGAFLLIMELVLRRIPAPIPIFIKIGDVLVTLGISFLASFIFYFVQVHMPEVKQKKNLYPVISQLFGRIISIEKSFITNFVNVNSFDALTEENIREGTNDRDVNAQNAPLHLIGANRSANWMEYGFSSVADIDKNWEMLMKYSAYMDSEMLLLLSKIQSNGTLGFFRTMKGIYSTMRQGIHLNGFDAGMVAFWGFVKEQDLYFNREFVGYGEQNDRVVRH